MLSPLNSLTTHVQKADVGPEPTSEQRQAAQQFEAIFLRQLLKGMEKSSGLSASEHSPGGQIYRSMMTDAFADSAARGGGIGLSDMVLQSLLDRGGAQAP